MATKRAKAVTLIPEPAPQFEQLMTIAEVANGLGVSDPTVYKLIREEGLPTVKLGDRRKVIPSELAVWVKQRSKLGM